MTKDSPRLSPDEWREYYRRNYLKCLWEVRIRQAAGLVETDADNWLLTAEELLTESSIQTRKVTNAHL